MSDTGAVKFDEIDYWSEIKLEIIEKYATAYSKILSAPANHYIHHNYVDGFAGPGLALSKTRNELTPGSPLRALQVRPPFEHYYLVDMYESKTSLLDALAEEARRMLPDLTSPVDVLTGDCSRVLLELVFPKLKYSDYQRALCVLDPYGLHLDWRVIETAGKLETVEIFLNFPVMDMNRNVLWANPEGVSEADCARMTSFWGDGSWRQAAYGTELTLFGDRPKKLSNEHVVEAFRERLKTCAGFNYVPEPMPMRNSKNAVVYYLFFGAQKPVAAGIVKDIFARYRDRRG